MSAGHYQLDNLVAIVDRNGLQITGSTEEVNQLEPLVDKFRAFGFRVRECDGNNVGELIQSLEGIPFEKGLPSLLLAKTKKGSGISFMENRVNWHHRVPNDQEFQQAMDELDAIGAAL